MIDLLRVELLRLRLRRAVLLLLVTAVVAPLVVLAATAWGTRPISAGDLREAQAQADEQVASGMYDRDLARCVRRPQMFGVRDEDPQAACEQIVLPQAEWFVYRSSLDLRVQREQGTGIAVVLIEALLLVLVGTTFAGHDWNSGSMSNQLLVEPRRSRVWLAKAAVVLATGSLLSLVMLVVYWTGLWALAVQRDLAIQPGAVDAGYKQAVLGAALVGAAGVGAYALTMLFRSTVATLGALLAVSVGGVILTGALSATGLVRLDPVANASAYLVGSWTGGYVDSVACSGSVGSVGVSADCVTRIGRAGATVYGGALLLLVTVPSVVSFRRRDVP